MGSLTHKTTNLESQQQGLAAQISQFLGAWLGLLAPVEDEAGEVQRLRIALTKAVLYVAPLVVVLLVVGLAAVVVALWAEALLLLDFALDQRGSLSRLPTPAKIGAVASPTLAAGVVAVRRLARRRRSEGSRAKNEQSWASLSGS